LTSGLKEFGGTFVVCIMSDNIAASKQAVDRLTFAMKLLISHQLRYNPRKMVNSFDVLTDISPFSTVCELLSDDGAINHAITVVGKFSLILMPQMS